MSIANASFELPSVGAGNFAFNPSGSSWTWIGTACGVMANGSSYNSGQDAPDGTQAALFAGGAQASQSFTDTPGTYCLVLSIARRNFGTTDPDVSITIDGVIVGQWRIPSNAYTDFTTFPFTITGTHTLAINALSTAGDETFFVDHLRLVSPVGVNAQVPCGGFESPILTNDTTNPAGTPWTYTGVSGIAPNSTSVSGAIAATEGFQAGWIQATGAISQDLAVVDGIYSLTFLDRQRSSQPKPQDIDVSFAGTTYGRFRAPSDHWPGAYRTIDNIEVAAGTHTLAFTGVDSFGTNAIGLIDDVHLELVSLPTGSPAVAGRLSGSEIRSGSSVTVNLRWAFGDNAGSPVVFTLTPSVGTVDAGTLTLAATSGATASTTLRIISTQASTTGTLTITNSAGVPTVTLDYTVTRPGAQITKALIDPDVRILSIFPTATSGGAALSCNALNVASPVVLRVNGTPHTLSEFLCDGLSTSVVCPLSYDQVYAANYDSGSTTTTGSWSTATMVRNLHGAISGVYKYSDSNGTMTWSIASPLVTPAPAGGRYKLYAAIVNDLENFGSNTRTTDATYTAKADGVTLGSAIHINQHAIDCFSSDLTTLNASYHYADGYVRYTYIGSVTIPSGTTAFTVTVANAAGSGRLIGSAIILESDFGPAFDPASTFQLEPSDGFIVTPVDATGATAMTPTVETDAQHYPFDSSADRSGTKVGYNAAGMQGDFPTHYWADVLLTANGWQSADGGGNAFTVDPVTGQLTHIPAGRAVKLDVIGSFGDTPPDSFSVPTLQYDAGPITFKFTTLGMPIIEFLGGNNGEAIDPAFQFVVPSPGTYSYSFTPSYPAQMFLINSGITVKVTSQGGSSDHVTNLKLFIPGTDSAWSQNIHPTAKDRFVGRGFGCFRTLNLQNPVTGNVACFEDFTPDGALGRLIDRARTFTIASLDPADISGNTDGNRDYWAAPNTNGRATIIVTVTPPGGLTPATATATVAGGSVTGITVTGGGAGYPFTPAVIISGGGGKRARAEVDADGMSGGAITTINVIDGGAGYTSAPTVHIAQYPLHPGQAWTLPGDGLGPLNDTQSNGAGGAGIYIGSAHDQISFPLNETQFLSQCRTTTNLHGATIPPTLHDSHTINAACEIDLFAGPSLQHLVQLFNDLDSTIWFHIGPYWTNACAERVARYLAQNCRAGIQFIIEYYNEPWNQNKQGFDYLLFSGQADLLRGGDTGGYDTWYVKRAGEVYAAFAAEWVAQGRDADDIGLVMGGQLSTDVVKTELEYAYSHSIPVKYATYATYDNNTSWHGSLTDSGALEAFYNRLDSTALIAMRGYVNAHAGLPEELASMTSRISTAYPSPPVQAVVYESGLDNLAQPYNERAYIHDFTTPYHPKNLLAELQFLELHRLAGVKQVCRFTDSGNGYVDHGNYHFWKDWSSDQEATMAPNSDGTLSAGNVAANPWPANLRSGLESPMAGARRYWASTPSPSPTPTGSLGLIGPGLTGKSPLISSVGLMS